MPVKVKWVIAFGIGLLLLWLGWLLPIFLTTFHVALCVVLVFIILMQSGSATDLAGAFGGAGSQTAFGPRTAATFLTKATVSVRDDVHAHFAGHQPPSGWRPRRPRHQFGSLEDRGAEARPVRSRAAETGRANHLAASRAATHGPGQANQAVGSSKS